MSGVEGRRSAEERPPRRGVLRRIRIPVQLAFLALFLGLLVLTVGTGEDRLGPPVRIFLEIDPLVGLATFLRTHALPGLLWLSAVTLVLSFLLGRFFCGWVCPLGTLGQITGRLRRRRGEERAPDRFRRSQSWKFAILLFLLGSALTGALWPILLDPLTILIRGLALGFGPGIEAVVRAAARGLSSTPLSAASEPLYRLVRDHALSPRTPAFELGMLMAVVLAVVLALSWVVRRFWCRYLCPLGALLGAAALAGTLRLRQDDERCTSCALCTYHCQGAADPDVMGGWRASECFVCGNCTASCNRSGLAFAFEKPRILRALRRARAARPAPAAVLRTSGTADPLRRKLLLGFGLGLIAGPVAGSSPSRRYPEANLIRPPGAAPEPEFLDRCIRCGECMKVCTGNGLHPAGLEAGPAALWSPVLRPRIGYCEYSCTLCGQVCPTGAIPRLSQEEKKRAVIGLAFVDPGKCLPYAFATPCIVCEEHCPTSPKAIQLEKAEVVAIDGTARTVGRPRIDPKLCIGCGICEYRCPLEGDAAIRIGATGRTGRGGPFQLGGDPYGG